MKLRSNKRTGRHIVTDNSGNKIVFGSLPRAIAYIWNHR